MGNAVYDRNTDGYGIDYCTGTWQNRRSDFLDYFVAAHSNYDLLLVHKNFLVIT